LHLLVALDLAVDVVVVARGAAGVDQALHEVGRHARDLPGPGDTGDQKITILAPDEVRFFFVEQMIEPDVRRDHLGAREDATEKAAVTPGPIAPARELLGEMLLALGQPVPALREFEATLVREPSRFRAVFGAAEAGRQMSDLAEPDVPWVRWRHPRPPSRRQL
jgi:hypothetical protein